MCEKKGVYSESGGNSELNYTQIADLWRTDDWGRCISNKIGTWFEVLEEYVYDTPFGIIMTIPKKTKMRFTALMIDNYRFEFERPHNFSQSEIGWGKSRLLKLKLKECSEFKENGEL